MKRLSWSLVGFAILVSTTACGDDDAPVAPSDMPSASLPAPEASAVVNYLEAANARSWPLWPNTTAQYIGSAPHGERLTTYVDPDGLAAVTSGAGTMPNGSFIVKENYTMDRELVETTVMYKSAGYDPANGDWFWLKQSADGTVTDSGMVAGCQNCHAAAADNDYVMTGPIG